MKVLFLSAGHSPDMSAYCLWDCLQAALGVDNVADGSGGDLLRGTPPDHWTGYDRFCLRREEGLHRRPAPDEDDFDLLVATTTFLREHDWDWLTGMIGRHLKRRSAGGKVVYYDCLDAPTEIFPPPYPVDAIFRREIDPAVSYPYPHKPLALTNAIPERWFHDPVYGWTDQKDGDVFNVSNATTTGHPVRWQGLSPTFCTSRRTRSLAGDALLHPPTLYLAVARRFKLTVVAPGGGVSHDQMRAWETIACGGIPLWLGQPCRPHWPWFTGEHGFWCQEPGELPRVIEEALDSDLDALRLRLREHALAYHTTLERGRQFLVMIEAGAYQGAAGPWRW